MGLIHLLFALKSPFYKRVRPITIFGFSGLTNYIESFKSILSKWITPDCGVIIHEATSLNFPDFSFELFKTIHSEESVGIKIFAEGKKIFYSSDTEYFAELETHSNNSDLAIFESASNHDKPALGHLSFKDVTKIDKNSNIKRVILSHFYPDSLPQKELLPKHFIIGDDLMKIDI